MLKRSPMVAADRRAAEHEAADPARIEPVSDCRVQSGCGRLGSTVSSLRGRIGQGSRR